LTQVVVQVNDVRAAVEEMRSRGVEFEEHDTPETRTRPLRAVIRKLCR
jgi:hypothetical protein